MAERHCSRCGGINAHYPGCSQVSSVPDEILPPLNVIRPARRHSKVTLELIHMPEDRQKIVGHFTFVQMTYNILRIPEGERTLPGGNAPGEIGHYDGTFWWVDGEPWTDVSIFATDDDRSIADD
jgi:hypothetical protein